MLDEVTLRWRVQIHEAPHADLELRFATQKLPEAPAPRAEPASEDFERAKERYHGREDPGLFLEERIDQDLSRPGGATPERGGH